MKGIYVSPDNIQANKNSQREIENNIDEALICINKYLKSQNKDELVKAINFISKEYVGDEISILE